MNEILMEEYFNDMLDDCYEDIVIMGMIYSPSVALMRIDPIAYRVSMNDYESSLRTEYESDGVSYKELFADEEEEEEEEVLNTYEVMLIRRIKK